MRALSRPRASLALALSVALVACASGPRTIAYGADACDFCRMVITDPRFGGEVVSARGQVHTFDSAECLASYVAAAGDSTIATVWVSDFRHPRTFVDAARAQYVRAPGGVSTPMGEAVFAFAPDADVIAEARALGGIAMRWGDVVALARSRARAAVGGRDAL